MPPNCRFFDPTYIPIKSSQTERIFVNKSSKLKLNWIEWFTYHYIIVIIKKTG